MGDLAVALGMSAVRILPLDAVTTTCLINGRQVMSSYRTLSTRSAHILQPRVRSVDLHPHLVKSLWKEGVALTQGTHLVR